jgi:hypothetical protein
MDRTALEHLSEQVNAEKAALEARLAVVARFADDIRDLLEMTPAETERTSAVVPPAGRSAEAAAAGEPRRATPARRRRAKKTPRGKDAARLILESDPSRFWTVRDVHDEEVRRGLTDFRPPGTPGNPPSRIALQRAQQEWPDNVEVQTAPVLAYKWNPRPSLSLNGSGSSHAAEVAERML